MEKTINEASLKDADSIAYLSYLAGLSHLRISVYDLMFPGPAGPTEERLHLMKRLLATRTVSWFHCSKFLVARVGGPVAACLSTFDKEEGSGRFFLAALQETGFKEPDIVAMGERMKPFLTVKSPDPPDTLIIENVATLSQYRRRGLVHSLLEAAIERGRDEGYRQMQVSLVIGNDSALNAYWKAGFRVAEENTDPSFEEIFNSPGMARMTLRL